MVFYHGDEEDREADAWVGTDGPESGANLADVWEDGRGWEGGVGFEDVAGLGVGGLVGVEWKE